MYPLGIILLLPISLQCALVKNSENVTDYLDRRLREAKVDIVKTFMKRDTEQVVPSSYDAKFVKLWSEELHTKRTLMVPMFNKLCLLEGNRVISVAVQPAMNGTSSALQQVAMIRYETPAKFVKSFLWKSNLYLLVCHMEDNACDFYAGTNDFRLEYKLLIQDKGWPMDAIFFTRADRLYLVVAHNTDQFLGSSVIYKWTGKFMDVIKRFATIGAVSVTAFNYKDSTMIIFGQNEKAQPNIGSLIYQFDNSGIEMIQYLSTNAPISVHYYTYRNYIFLVVVNELVASDVYWWDGNEFVYYTDLPDIVAPRMVNVAHFNGETLFFVSYETHVTLYRVSISTNYTRLDLLEFKNGERVVDMGVWIDDNTLTLLVVTVDPSHLYRIEPWELRMKKNPKANLKEEDGATESCLAKLESRLNDRMAEMENLTRNIWPRLLPSAKNINIGALTGGNGLEKLVLHSGSIGKLSVQSSGEILLASDVATLAASPDGAGSRKLVNSILEESRRTMKIHGVNRLVGNVTILGNATIRSLQASDLHTERWNGRSMDFDKSVISATRDQKFAKAELLGKSISVERLYIDQLCGIPFEYWLRDPSEKSSNIFLKNETLEIINDTIVVQTDLLSLDRLNLRTFDGVVLDNFFNDLFIPGERQLVKGNIIQHSSESIKVGDLVVKELNGVAQKDFMTISTDQSLENVFVKTMSIQNLVATKVNDVPVSESAMVSKKNHIKGLVTIARMRILDELAIENPSKFPKFRPVQVYDDVTIVGNLKAEDLVFEPYTIFDLTPLNGSVIENINIDSLFKTYWTKSSEQVVDDEISFDAGITVDELRLRYLNGLDVNEDIMRTTVEEIGVEFGSLEFTNFIASGWIVEETEDPEAAIPLWSSTVDSLILNEELRIGRLGAQHLNIDTFNGIPVVEIMNRNPELSGPYEYPPDSVQRFDSITVNEVLKTENLDLRFMNSKELQLDDILQIDGNYTLQYLKVKTLTLENLAFACEAGNHSELSKFVNYLQEIVNSSESASSKISLTIDGELVVENDLQVAVINHMGTQTYLEDLAAQDFAVISDDALIIDSLVVHRDLTLNLLHDTRVESLERSILSKSRAQNLSDAQFFFGTIWVDDLRTERVNKRLMSNLVYTDAYDINFGGDVSFTKLKLSLDEDTQTKSLNGYPLDTLYKRLGEIPSTKINDFTVNGNVSWETHEYSTAGSVQLGPLETIIRNALVKSSNASQVINGETRINSPSESSPGVFVRRMRYRQNYSNTSSPVVDRLQGIDIRKIVNDAVLDDPFNDRGIQVGGEKIFAKDLKTSRLNVAGEIGIASLNNWNVKDLNESVVRKESLGSLIGEDGSSRSFNGRPIRQGDRQENTMIFRQEVKIARLVIQPKDVASSGIPIIHGVPVSNIFLSTDDNYLPNNTYLKHLEVTGNAFIQSLDNVDFNDFVRDRVDIHSNHEIHANLQFNGRVQVTEGATIRTINGIFPSDFVMSDSEEEQRIVGQKIFDGLIETHGKTYATTIGEINLTEEYDNGVVNYQNTDIFGDIVFKADIFRPIESAESTLRWQLSPESFANGMRLRSFLKDRDTEELRILEGLKRNESRLELAVARASNASSHLPEIFYYFETADDLKISVAGVDRVEVMKVEELTILNMYANELGSFCGLQDECPCRRQYEAEIRSGDCESREIKGPRIVYNFHEPDGAFGVSVATSSVSSSKKCSTTGDKSSTEFTTISWMRPRPGDHQGANGTENALKIYGYLSDVKVFTQNDLLFIVLAIYYDPIKQTHETNSFIYVLDLAAERMVPKLVQGIPTSHATGVQVFKIPSKGAHILFTSSGGAGKSSESLLYRLEPSTAKFVLLRTFTTGGNRHGKSVSQPKDEFLFLDDVATNSINVYVYDAKWDNFYFYQSLYHSSMAPISSIESLYAGEFRRSQVYVIVTTKYDEFVVYEYNYFAKFQIIARMKMKGILTMVPFDVSSRRYMFVGSETNSTILRVIEQGWH